MREIGKIVLTRAVVPAAIVAVACTVVVVVLTSQFYVRLSNEQSRQVLVQIENDYNDCIRGNESRAALRALMDHVANPNPVDASVIQDPELRAVIQFQQARGQDFRRQNAQSFMPRDCEGERQQKLQTGTVSPGTTR